MGKYACGLGNVSYEIMITTIMSIEDRWNVKDRCQRELIHMLAGQVVVLDPIRWVEHMGGPFLSQHP